MLAIAAALLWRAGGLPDMIQILFVWNAKYSRLRPPVPMASSPLYQTTRFVLGLPYRLLFPIGLLALLGAADLALRPSSARLRWLIPTWALLLAISVWIQGKYYTYHWLPALPPLALLAGQGLRAAGTFIRGRCSHLAAGALCAAGIVCLIAILADGYWRACQRPIRCLLGRVPRAALWQRYDRYGDFSLSADLSVARVIGQRSTPDDTIFIWGFEPLVYFLSDRAPASRFIYAVPLVTAWSPPAWRADLMNDLDRMRPRFILVVHRDVLPWMTGRLDDSAAQLATYPDLARLLETRYRKAERIEDFILWERR